MIMNKFYEAAFNIAKVLCVFEWLRVLSSLTFIDSHRFGSLEISITQCCSISPRFGEILQSINLASRQ